ncbi:hypothetical protein HPB51_014335 [Rhipicephalus microplus]|uniref:Uncharacterized protein n=1 Tax=Rhipicephalus microplus TaxID=6941 RepID=A0A9J6ENK8_RHIMP|nr:hypothetical protein HPB51_014335 [Rhipicephalus microplus]
MLGRTIKMAAPRTGPPRGSAVVPHRGRDAATVALTLVGRSVGRRCADAERPWGGSKAMRRIRDCDSVACHPWGTAGGKGGRWLPGRAVGRRLSFATLGGRLLRQLLHLLDIV